MRDGIYTGEHWSTDDDDVSLYQTIISFFYIICMIVLRNSISNKDGDGNRGCAITLQYEQLRQEVDIIGRLRKQGLNDFVKLREMNTLD